MIPRWDVGEKLGDLRENRRLDRSGGAEGTGSTRGAGSWDFQGAERGMGQG